MPLTLGGVSERPDSCVGDVVTDFFQQNGVMNEMISRQLESQSPLLRLGNMTKKQFPAGAGDIYTKVVLTATRAQSTAGKNWTALKAAYPGGAVPSCRTPSIIRYGHLKTQACLEKSSLRTEDFNAVDLTFKTRRDQQWSWLVNTILPGWSLDTQKFWYREAYRKTVWNIVLNQTQQHPRQIGDFVTHTKPSSVLTPDHLDEFYRFLQGYGANQTPYTGTGDGMMYHVLVTGPDEFRILDEIDRRANHLLGSQWNDAIVIPGYGKVRAIRNWVIMVEDDITRLGENADGSYVEIESTREVAVGEGYESVANPDYYNPGVAKYTVHYLWNISAAEWYIPPDFTQFPNQKAGNWNGSFQIVNLNTPEDPNAENAYFLATFAFGIGPNVEPRRGACVLSLAVHRRGQDVCVANGQLVTSSAPTEYPVKNFTLNFYTSRLSFESNAVIPSSCPSQYSLYLVTQGGRRAKVSAVNNSQTSTAPYQYEITLVDSSLATVRECDPWAYIACLPDYEATTVTVGDDCITCGGSTPVCDFEAQIETVYVRNIRLKDGTQLNDESGFNFPYDVSDSSDRTQLDTDLTTWLASNGGGAVVVSYASGVVTVTVTGTEACLNQLLGDDGALTFVRSNCVAAS